MVCVILHVTNISLCEEINSLLQEIRGSLLRNAVIRKMMLIPNTYVYAHFVKIAVRNTFTLSLSDMHIRSVCQCIATEFSLQNRNTYR